MLVASAARRRHGGVLRSLFSTPKARSEEERFASAARALLQRFGLPDSTPAAELPVGDQRALMLAAATATGAPVLLVDEPTAGASLREAERLASLVAALRDDGLALLVVEHNVRLVTRLADTVVELR